MEKLPSLVIVGRPNVGKSTLFNRLTGTRRSIVTNEPGITRDRIYGKAEWRGRNLEIVDTGGIVPDDKALIPQEILRQAHIAISKAALLVLVVDSQAGLTPLDEELARLLRATGKPFVVAANKVDAMSQEANAAAFHRLGVPVFPIAAEHGTGVDDLLDVALAETHDDAENATEEKAPDAVEVAIIGRPNVGKSTLLNRMVGEDRSIVSPVPGTTMDTVDTEVVHDGHLYRFVDTAGIRRKGKTNLVAEKLSVVMARRGLERCDVALLIVDGEQGVTQGDAQIASYAEQSGRSVIIVMNKWDLATEAARKASERDAGTTKGKAKLAARATARPRAGARANARISARTVARSRAQSKTQARGQANRGFSIGAGAGSGGGSVREATAAVHGSAAGGHAFGAPDRVSFGQDRGPRGQAVSADRPGRGGAQKAHLHAGIESLAEGRGRSAARDDTEGAAGADLLHDPSEDGAAYVFDFHEPEDAAALQLRAVSGESAAGEVGFSGGADPICAAVAEAGAAAWGTAR